MTSQLNQVIAVVSGKKTKVQAGITEVYHKVQKDALFQGIQKVYRKTVEDAEDLPTEKSNIQYGVGTAVHEVSNLLTELFDIVLTQDVANTVAKADVIVDGKVIANEVPVPYLLFLEKQIEDVRTFVGKLPTLDTAETWSWDDKTNCYSSEPRKTNRTQKVRKAHVLYPATEKHPAQVEAVTEDVVVGQFETTKFSSAIKAQEKKEILDRVEKLSEAVKVAREKANLTTVVNRTVGKNLFGYIFGGK